MKYLDMHCDTLTQCLDAGYSPSDCNLQINFNMLESNGCAAQCFAIFTQGDGSALRVENYLAFYREKFEKYAVRNFADLERCLDGGRAGVILTVENLGFIGDDLSRLYALGKEGVKMASLVWNYENALAYPNLVFSGGMPLFERGEKRGLKPLGRQAAEILDELGIIIDVSHLSDGGCDELLHSRKIPLVASHSNCRSVCNVSRNLTDGQIKKIAACGGVVGINFCKDFLGAGNTLECVYRHLFHLINTGGEDIAAFGSDFDGIPAPDGLENCSKMPALIDYILSRGMSPRVAEKLCYKNFARVFKEVCG